MKKPTTQVHDISTGQILIRELTDDEISQQEIDKIESERMINESRAIAESKYAQKEEVLNKLGITEEQARLLLS